ncbi:MAG: energy transducer TonB [Gelidibacter sp.]
MKNLNNIDENAVINSEISEISKKQSVNLQSNSSLYFQIGLILCLLATYGLLEMNFKYQLSNIIIGEPIEDPETFYMPEVTITPDVPKQEPVVKQIAMITDRPPIVKPNNFVDPKPMEIITPDAYVPDTKPAINAPVPNETPAPPAPTTLNMRDVERVPVFPGCESATNNTERMACMSEKLTKLVQKKFDTDLAADLGLTGVQRIFVEFTINDKGQVTNIKSRAPYPQLENEAKRVVEKIPVMTPGMQRNTPVSVIYNLPIIFKVQ